MITLRNLLLPAAVASSMTVAAENPSSLHYIKDEEPFIVPILEAWNSPDTVAEKEIIRLTEADFERAAKRLGVEVAAIKAVADIEAGVTHNGFFAPEKPLINFDLTMFRRFAQSHGIKLGNYTKSHPVVFSRPNTKKYGSTQAGQQARLEAAMSIDSLAAMEGTFWGMFQIGGFNWKKCGASSPQDFMQRMARSEGDQLDMFANFILDNKLEVPLRKKDWATFARIYNGPSYKQRGYHTRMAAAYRKYSSEKKKSSK